IDDVVQPPLEVDEQQLAGHALLPAGLLEAAPELALEKTVETLDLLLLAQLHAVPLQLDASLAVLPRPEVTALDGALLGLAARPLQKQLGPRAAAQPADGPPCPGQCVLLPSDPTALRRPAAVVRDRRDVLDRLDFHADGLQGADGRLAPRARPGDP